MNSTYSSLPLRSRQLASRLPPLLVAAQRVAQSVYQGEHGRRRSGTGDSFWQFRRYAAGDPAASIDWRQSARTDKLYVREREKAVAQSVYLWADPSGSMRYASHDALPTKADQAQLLTLALACLLQRGGEQAYHLDRAGAVPLRGPQGLERMALALAQAIQSADASANLPPPFPAARHAQIVLASDFLLPIGELRRWLAEAASAQRSGILLQIIDPAEEDFPFTGRVELQGCEDEGELLLANAASIKAAYRAKMQAHQATLKQLATSAGWRYLRHRTDEAPATALLQLYRQLAGTL